MEQAFELISRFRRRPTPVASVAGLIIALEVLLFLGPFWTGSGRVPRRQALLS
jgi:hypothetical protein